MATLPVTEKATYGMSDVLQQIRAICIQARTSLGTEGPLTDEEALERIADLLFDKSGEAAKPVSLQDPAQELAERVAEKWFGHNWQRYVSDLATLIASELRAGGWTA